MAKKSAGEVVPTQAMLFEAVIKAFRPFAKDYSITNAGQVKLPIDPLTDAVQLNAAVHHAGSEVEHKGSFVFVRFEGISNQDAKEITAREFGNA